ncbi:uncharacterized protein LOC132563711 [Ylistrum balloti]|uniref:uncharacterized protein LOC132563711 n=1 Tax=Ylistrum balloti TaxID=509963 RepID=UPI002905E27E|nr:uncharacterized protein LOC132563711 [Ylistrum balloti]
MERVEEIAIVGIGCRFPGANNIKEFWKILVNGENHVNEIPGERWNLDAIYDPDPDAYGKTYVRRAGVLSKYNVWDNDFFGISEKEASEMDPQQRYVLECVHMALEDGGITRAEIDGSPTSVYIGAMNCDSKTSKDGDYSLLTNYTVTGDAASIITARVSYNYNLLGPSLTIDTACSSSLVAIHLATQSLKQGESSMAICGGVNSILYPDMFVTLTKARMASPTGQCQAFSANADGYARGEGCGIIILERLNDALKNGRNIWATIRTGCNQDGQTVRPITAPSGIQQNRLLHDIYLHSNNINPSHVQYIEAHGTGTPIGDPVEVNSLGSFFKDYPIQPNDVTKQRFIGSVKTNIGHLESGAGAASLIKTLLMMNYAKIVPSLHSLPRNPKIDFENYELQIPTSVNPWPVLEDGSRAACINCFGFGGTNSHAFVRQWVGRSNDTNTTMNKNLKSTCIPLSAKSQTCLIKVLSHLVKRLTEEPCDLKQLSYTASCKRDHFRYRKLFVAFTIADLIESCTGAIERMKDENIKPGRNIRIVYVFCGVGTTWTKMGMELVRHFPVFADTLKRIDNYLTSMTGWSVEDIIRDGAKMDDPFISHIGIFACQVGLSDLWKHWGISPDAIVGQSVGEVAAAYSSGVLPLKDAVKVIYHRSRLLAEESGGKMIVVTNVNTTYVSKICKKVGHVDIAVHISPNACTISGDAKEVNEVKNLIAMHTKNTNEIPLFHDLNVQCAYHSFKMENAAKRITECLNGIKANPPDIPVFSTVTGMIAEDFGTPEYWKKNVERPVLFHQAIKESTGIESTIFLELGPRPVLKAHLSDIFTKEVVTSIPCMKFGTGSIQVLTALGDLYTLGVNPCWENIVEKTNLTDLPQYQFDGKVLMVESDYRFLRKQGLMNDCSGRYLMLTQTDTKGKFKVNLSPSETPFVYDHVIDDVVIIPGAVYAEVAFELGMSVMNVAAECLHVEYDIIKVVPLSKDKPFYLDITSNIEETNDCLMKIVFSITNDTITVVEGSVTNRYPTHLPIVQNEDICISTGNNLESEQLYKTLAMHGYKYGTRSQILERITFNKNECTGYINLTEGVARQINRTAFHPAILDAMLHSSALIFLSHQNETSNKIYPVRLGSVTVFRSLEKRMLCYTRIIKEVNDRSITNIILTTQDGLVLAEVKEIEHQIMNGSTGVNNFAYQIVWTEENVPNVISDTQDDPKQNVIICYDDSGIHSLLRNHYPRGESFRLRDVADDPESMISAIDTEGVKMTLIVPDSNTASQSESSDHIFYNICKCCEAFLKIMKKLKYTDKTLIIVTENTQDGGYENNIKQNVFGSELWGFARSLRQEGTRCRIVLIDIQPSIPTEVETLNKAILFFLSSDQASTFTECLVADGKIHSNFLQRGLHKGLENVHRTLYPDTNLRLQVRSTKSDRVERPFLIPADNTCVSKKNDVILQVDEICIHSPSVFCVTELDSSIDNSLWTDCQGYPVIGLEFQGTIMGKKQVVACYPTRATNLISIPECCVCERSKLPMYTPGLIINAMLMWHIMQHVGDKSVVYIVTDSDPSDDASLALLRDMILTTKHSQVKIASIHSLNDARECENGVFVLLEKHSLTDIACILRSGNTIVGCFDVMRRVSTRQYQMCSKGIKVCIITEKDVFSDSNVISNFPQVIRWLKRQSRNCKVTYNNRRPLMTIKFPHAKDSEKDDMEIKAVGDMLIHNNATYIVVGGLTGLGWEIVKWLGCKGAGIVVSLSRRDCNQQMIVQLQNAMDIHDFQIVPMKCNIGNYADVKKTFGNIKSQFPNYPIKGIFQGAGVLKDTRIETMTMENFKSVLCPKVLGSWNLHLVSRELPLDFFVMHSSTTSVFGNAGQTNYGAANSFMDSLALYRRANNLPGQSINWGALAVGMASKATIRSSLEANGYFLMETNQIKECLLDILTRNPSQIVYGLFDWNILRKNPAMMRTSAIDSDEMSNVSQSSMQQHVSTVLDIANFKEASHEEQRQIIATLFFTSLSRVLSAYDREQVNNQNLLSIGMESQKAIELIHVFKDATGCRLPLAYILSPEYSVEMLIDFAHSSITDNFDREVHSPAKYENVHESPSWMEKFYLNIHEINQKDSSLWFSIAFKLGSGLSNIGMWHTVLRWITIKHRELRTVYQPSGRRFGFRKVILDPEDAKVDFRFVDFCVITSEKDKDIAKYCTFDITTDPPLRVLYCDTGKNHHLRFIISHITMDLGSLFTLIEQLQSYLTAFFFHTYIDFTPVEIPDFAVLMEERIESERVRLDNFWRGELEKSHSLPSVVGNKVPKHMSGMTKKLSIRLPKELVDNISHNVYHITVPTLLFSLYQILLHEMTCVSAVPVVLTVDMRRHFPEFIGEIFLGTNYVPVITQLPSVCATLRECISLCSNQVLLASENSLYPFQLIKQIDNDKENHFRHFFNVRDISKQLNKREQHSNYYMKNIGYITGFLNKVETALNVVTGRQDRSMELVLSYDSEIVSSSKAESMLNDIVLLASGAVANPDLRLYEIPLECCQTEASDKIDHYLPMDYPVNIRYSKECEKMRSDEQLVEAVCQQQANNLLEMTIFFDIAVQVVPHSSLNTSKSIIPCLSLQGELLQGKTADGQPS